MIENAFHYNGPQTDALAAVYRRVSTDQQENSLEVQEQKITHYAQFKGLEINREFSDEATSGSKPIVERKGGSALLMALRRGEAKHLIIAKLDRLGRDAIDILTTLNHITKDLGVVVHIIDLGGDSLCTDNPYSKFVIGTIALFAELERDRIRTRIQEVFDHKFSKHELIGTVPYGYDAIETEELNARDKRKRILVPNPVEQQIIQRIHAARQSGQTYTAIAQDLNDTGLATKQGRIGGDAWQASTVRKVLTSKHTTRLLQEWSKAS